MLLKSVEPEPQIFSEGFFKDHLLQIPVRGSNDADIHLDQVCTPYPLSPAAICRKFAMSRSGGVPNKRLYSRLNCEGLS